MPDFEKLLEERLKKLSQVTALSNQAQTQLSALNEEVLRLQGEVRLLQTLQPKQVETKQ